MRSFLLLSVLHFTLSCVYAQNNTIVIPVVVHVVYNNPQQNISKEQINSQIAALNADYRKRNKDIVNIPAAFKSLAADSRIEFRLATEDPSGIATDGILRVPTAIPSFGRDEKIKSSLTGGSDPWNRDQYLNIWTGNLTAGILGYSSSPGCAASVDGVVIRYDVFGTTANVRAPYNKGRTTVHEIGHWLGLRHIWGDTDCGDDGIDDTPPQAGPTRGCPSGVVATCSSGAAGNMYMNFMDFTNDDCLSMFTIGQVDKMHELFSKGGAREPLLWSTKADGAEDPAMSPVPTLSVFPNPACRELTITVSHGALRKLGIYNHLGQLCREITITKTVERINIEDLTRGMYFISAGNNKVLKFIKN